MKLKTLASAAILAAFTVSAYADTNTDSKDMKQIAAVPPPPAACDSGFYVGVFGGVNFAQDYGNDRAELSDSSFIPNASIDLRGTTKDNLGAVGGLKVGYNFESWDLGFLGLRIQPAIELEGFYQGANLDSKYSTSLSLGPTTVSANGYLRGNLSTAAFFTNGIFRLKTGSIVTPYIGAGIGGEYLSLSNVRAGGQYQVTDDGTTESAGNAGETLQDEDDVVFAAQALGGFDIEIAQHWVIFTEYKYTVGFNPDFNFGEVIPGTGVSAKFDPSTLSQQSVNAGVKYNF